MELWRVNLQLKVFFIIFDLFEFVFLHGSLDLGLISYDV